MPDVGTSAATSDLTDFVAEAFGDFSAQSEPAEETPAPGEGAAGEPQQDAGAAPENATEAAVGPDQPETAAVAAPDGTTEAPPAEAVDPLKDYQPLTYGEGQVLEGVHVHPEGGAVVDPDTLPQLIEALQERAELQAARQEADERQQTFDRVTQWTVYGPDGKPTETLSGVNGALQMRVDYERALALATTFGNVLKDPQALLELFAQDQNGALVVNPRAVTNLTTAAELAAMRAEGRARQAFQSLQSPPTRTEAPTGPLTFAPEQAQAAVKGLAKSWGISGLSEANVTKAATYLSRFSHPANAEEAKAAGVKVGQPVVENAFKDLLADYLANQQSVKQTGKLAAENSARMAAAKPPASPAKPVTRPTQDKPKSTRATDADQFFKMQEAGSRGQFLVPSE